MTWNINLFPVEKIISHTLNNSALCTCIPLLILPSGITLDLSSNLIWLRGSSQPKLLSWPLSMGPPIFSETNLKWTRENQKSLCIFKEGCPISRLKAFWNPFCMHKYNTSRCNTCKISTKQWKPVPALCNTYTGQNDSFII